MVVDDCLRELRPVLFPAAYVLADDLLSGEINTGILAPSREIPSATASGDAALSWRLSVSGTTESGYPRRKSAISRHASAKSGSSSPNRLSR